MKYLLDTCFVSEFVKPRPNAQVVEWGRRHDEREFGISVLLLGEIQKGISRLPTSRRRRELQRWLDTDLGVRFAERVLLVTPEVAHLWGDIQGQALQRGEPLPVVDSLLAATAIDHGLIVVTQNEHDIKRAGAATLNPWTPAE